MRVLAQSELDVVAGGASPWTFFHALQDAIPDPLPAILEPPPMIIPTPSGVTISVPSGANLAFGQITVYKP